MVKTDVRKRWSANLSPEILPICKRNNYKKFLIRHGELSTEKYYITDNIDGLSF